MVELHGPCPRCAELLAYDSEEAGYVACTDCAFDVDATLIDWRPVDSYSDVQP